MRFTECTIQTLIFYKITSQVFASVASASSSHIAPTSSSSYISSSGANPASSPARNIGEFASSVSSSSDDSDDDHMSSDADIENSMMHEEHDLGYDYSNIKNKVNRHEVSSNGAEQQGSSGGYTKFHKENLYDSQEEEEEEGGDEMNDNDDTTDAGSLSSQPLKTLKKLQAMLEETDYVTTTTATTTTTTGNGALQKNMNHSNKSMTSGTSNNRLSNGETLEPVRQQPYAQDGDVQSTRQFSRSQQQQQQQGSQTSVPSNPLPVFDERVPNNKKKNMMETLGIESNIQDREQEWSPSSPSEIEQLWTSKDRSKYKRQRKLQRERELQRQQRQKYMDPQQEPQMQSDDDSNATEDTDDGLGYTLPNLPVYFSDAESTDDQDYESATTAAQEKQTVRTPSLRNMGGLLPVQNSNPNYVNPSPQQQQQPPKIINLNDTLEQYDANFQRRFPQQQGQSPPYQYHNLSQQYAGQHYIHGHPPMTPLSPQQQIQQQQQQQQTQSQHQIQSQPQMPQGAYPFSQQGHGPAVPYNIPYQQPPPPPYLYMSGHHAHMQQQHPQQHYSGWPAINPTTGYPIPYSGYPYHPTQVQPQPQSHISTQSHLYSPSTAASQFIPRTNLLPPPPKSSSDVSLVSGMRTTVEQNPRLSVASDGNAGSNTSITQQLDQRGSKPTTIGMREAGFSLSFDSIQKIVFYFTGTLLLSYCAVSPRTLEFAEYNKKFKRNVQRTMLIYLVPSVAFLLFYDANESSLNSLINTFYASATLGYCIALILEIVVTTIIRLGVFLIWEPAIFGLTPQVPLIVLPWTLREQSYRPKRITLFAADFAATCIASPLIEEYIKLKIVELSTKLPSNYRWKTVPKSESKKNKKKQKRKKRSLEEIDRLPDQAAVTNINSYMAHMYAASLGLKLCDTTRRVLLYTKHGDAHKSFYAFFRGFYPIHELCGSMTALELAKRNVLGLNLPLWRMLFPAVFIHGMANLKGKKPIFKWNSASPWSEIQMAPWYIRDQSMTTSQLISKGFNKFMWFVVMGRVLGYIIKNYYLIGRKAVKRTTTFAGKNASFSAELEMETLLKKKQSSAEQQHFKDVEGVASKEKSIYNASSSK